MESRANRSDRDIERPRDLVVAEVRPREQVEFMGVLNEYPAVPVAGGIQLQLGDAYEGDRRRVIFALHVPALIELGVAPIADVVLRYVSVGREVSQRPTVVDTQTPQRKRPHRLGYERRGTPGEVRPSPQAGSGDQV